MPETKRGYETRLTLSDVGRGGQKGNKWECFQKFSNRKVHFPCGLMDKALDFELFDAQRGKEMVVLLLEYH